MVHTASVSSFPSFLFVVVFGRLFQLCWMRWHPLLSVVDTLTHFLAQRNKQKTALVLCEMPFVVLTSVPAEYSELMVFLSLPLAFLPMYMTDTTAMKFSFSSPSCHSPSPLYHVVQSIPAEPPLSRTKNITSSHFHQS